MKLYVKNIILSILIVLLMVSSYFTVSYIKENSTGLGSIKINSIENSNSKKIPSNKGSKKSIKSKENTSTSDDTATNDNTTSENNDTTTKSKTKPSTKNSSSSKSTKSNNTVTITKKTKSPKNLDLFYILYGFETMCIGVSGTVLAFENIKRLKER